MCHGDLHTGNILIFKDEKEGIIAKWCDFGCGYDNGRGLIDFHTYDETLREFLLKPELENRIWSDCQSFADIVEKIWEDRNEDEEPHDVRALADRHIRISYALKNVNNLNELLAQWGNFLIYGPGKRSKSRRSKSRKSKSRKSKWLRSRFGRKHY